VSTFRACICALLPIFRYFVLFSFCLSFHSTSLLPIPSRLFSSFAVIFVFVSLHSCSFFLSLALFCTPISIDPYIKQPISLRSLVTSLPALVYLKIYSMSRTSLIIIDQMYPSPFPPNATPMPTMVWKLKKITAAEKWSPPPLFPLPPSLFWQQGIMTEPLRGGGASYHPLFPF
jgi:hypothetical protein